MSTATAPDLTLPLLGGRYHFLLRRLHSITGIMFGGYLIVHLVVNATIAQRGGIYQFQVNKIHELPWLPVVEWLFIFLPIIYHAVYGTWIIVTGQPNVASYPYLKNWNYLLQRISAVIIILFVVFHVLTLKYNIVKGLGFDPHQAQRSIMEHMRFSPAIAWVVYPIGVLASAFHTANGFFTAAITWGLTVSAGGQRRWGAICTVLFVLLLAAGMIALAAAATQPLPAPIHAGAPAIG